VRKVFQFLLFALLSLNCRAAIIPILNNVFTTNQFPTFTVDGAVLYYDLSAKKFTATRVAYTNGIYYDPTLGFLSIVHTNNTGDPLLILSAAGPSDPSIQGYADKFVVVNTNMTIDAVSPYSIRLRLNNNNVLEVVATGIGTGGVSLNNYTNVISDNGTTITYNGIPIGGFIFRETDLGIVAGAGTASLNTNVYFYRGTFSGATFNVNLPTLSASTIHAFAQITGTNTFGATQIGTFKVAGVTTALWSERDHAAVTTITNEIGAGFTVTFRAKGGTWSRVDIEGDGGPPGGLVINPTDSFLPIRTSATTFGDSPIYLISDATHQGLQFIEPILAATSLALTEDSILGIGSDGAVITPAVSNLPLFNPAATNRTFTVGNGYGGSGKNAGMILLLRWTGVSTATLANGGNAILNGNWNASADGDMIQLLWDGVNVKWRELWRNPSTSSQVLYYGGQYGFGASGITPTNLMVSNMASGTTDIYTVPAAKRFLIDDITVVTTNATSTTIYALLKTNGVYYRWNGNGSFTSAGGLTLNGVPGSNFFLEAGESIAVNATLPGVNVTVIGLLFPTNAPVYTPRLLTLSAGNNTLYTCPPGKCAVNMTFPNMVAVGKGQLFGTYINDSGVSRTLVFYRVPSGGTPGNDNFTFSAIATDKTAKGIQIAPLFPGDSIVINTDASTSSQWARITVAEIPFP